MSFDIVSRANNHSLDWGLEGMRETNRPSGSRLESSTQEWARIEVLARAPGYLENAKAQGSLGLGGLDFSSDNGRVAAP